MLEHRTLIAGDIKRKEDLLGYFATDDDFDEINDNVDTFRTFTDSHVESNYLDEITFGDDQELNIQIIELCTPSETLHNRC